MRAISDPQIRSQLLQQHFIRGIFVDLTFRLPERDRSLFGQGPPTCSAEACGRAMKGGAVGALTGFKGMGAHLFLLHNPVGIEDLSVDVLPRKVAVRGEHCGVEVAPHHRLDH